MQQTIDIPARPKGEVLRLTLEVPKEVPAGRTILTFTPAPAEDQHVSSQEMFDQAAIALGYENHRAYLEANSPRTVEEALAEAAKKLADPNRKPFSRHFGILAGDNLYGDGTEYQRKMRDEWPD
jgi:hypothetical protein